MAFIIKPLVTEKMTKITDKQPNRYGFVVRPEANKLEIKKEIEGLYNVTVVDVNTIRYAGKRSARYTKAGVTALALASVYHCVHVKNSNVVACLNLLLDLKLVCLRKHDEAILCFCLLCALLTLYLVGFSYRRLVCQFGHLLSDQWFYDKCHVCCLLLF